MLNKIQLIIAGYAPKPPGANITPKVPKINKVRHSCCPKCEVPSNAKKQTEVSNYFSSKNEVLKNSTIVKNLLKYNLAELNCKTIKKINIGDHLFFVAKVLNFKLKNEKKPLIYFASKYKKLV